MVIAHSLTIDLIDKFPKSVFALLNNHCYFIGVIHVCWPGFEGTCGSSPALVQAIFSVCCHTHTNLGIANLFFFQLTYLPFFATNFRIVPELLLILSLACLKSLYLYMQHHIGTISNIYFLSIGYHSLRCVRGSRLYYCIVCFLFPRNKPRVLHFMVSAG